MLHRKQTAPLLQIPIAYIAVVYSENHVKHINTLCGQYLDFLMLKRVVHFVNTVLCMFNGLQNVL
jgi:hypothetical protein